MFCIHIYLNNVSVLVSGIITTTTADSPLGLFKVSLATCGFFFFLICSQEVKGSEFSCPYIC